MSACDARAIEDAVRERGASIATLFLHAGCALRCRFCASEDAVETMSVPCAESALQTVREAGIRNVVLGGGEPALWPHDLHALCAHARRLGHFVQVSTSGIDLDRHLGRGLAADRFLLPLEAVDARVHDAARQTPGLPSHHRAVLDALDALERSAREVTITTVAFAHNLDQIARLGRLLRERARAGLRIHAWHLYRFVATGRGGASTAGEYAIDDRAWRGAIAEARASVSGFPVFVRPDIRHSRTVLYLWLEAGRMHMGPFGALASRA